VYSTCIFCGVPLGRNEAIEAFPVGRRLAFDAERGRLWVVCPRCARWNLTPLDERWEALEQCERLFRGTRLRASTDNVGLARVRDGTELVRLGAALRPEMAVWRYGEQFGRRRLRNIAAGYVGAVGLGLAGVGVLAAGALTGGLGLIGIAGIIPFLSDSSRPVFVDSPAQVAARLPTPDGTITVRRLHLGRSSFVPDEHGETALRVTHDGGVGLFTGEDAARAAARLLPAVNRFAGRRDEVEHALARLDDAGDARRFVASFARRTGRLTDIPDWRRLPSHPTPDVDDYRGLNVLAHSATLALEMALHEESERRAMEGELAELERAWREAEEIAAIADDLLIPASVRQALARVRGRPSG
jgi:hypothetical protein